MKKRGFEHLNSINEIEFYFSKPLFFRHFLADTTSSWKFSLQLPPIYQSLNFNQK